MAVVADGVADLVGLVVVRVELGVDVEVGVGPQFLEGEHILGVLLLVLEFVRIAVQLGLHLLPEGVHLASLLLELDLVGYVLLRARPTLHLALQGLRLRHLEIRVFVLGVVLGDHDAVTPQQVEHLELVDAPERLKVGHVAVLEHLQLVHDVKCEQFGGLDHAAGVVLVLNQPVQRHVHDLGRQAARILVVHLLEHVFVLGVGGLGQRGLEKLSSFGDVAQPHLHAADVGGCDVLDGIFEGGGAAAGLQQRLRGRDGLGLGNVADQIGEDQLLDFTQVRQLRQDLLQQFVGFLLLLLHLHV
mmetsp:Transcript_91126/g.197115  ORF Transcript_91126/g.197115 Transcript_91126/m.197115 type:complete len:301 (+) Transcript_91126:316-1218(+)